MSSFCPSGPVNRSPAALLDWYFHPFGSPIAYPWLPLCVDATARGGRSGGAITGHPELAFPPPALLPAAPPAEAAPAPPDPAAAPPPPAAALAPASATALAPSPPPPPPPPDAAVPAALRTER